MKVLFLDLDGVMVPIFGTHGNDCAMKKENKWNTDPFSLKAVGMLNWILRETGAEIVLSSDWRNHFTLSEIREIFAENGVLQGPIGFTSNSKLYTADKLEEGRTAEIREWVDRHGVTNWVAVDDLDLFELGNHFVHCKRPQMGLKQSGIKERIVKILNAAA